MPYANKYHRSADSKRPTYRDGESSNHGFDVNHIGAEYTADELEFLRAIDHYKKWKQRPHPTWHEVLEVLKSLGYRKVENAS